jgi:hypothetical protein
MSNLKDIEVKVDRSDLIFLHRVIDNVLPELQAAVADGLIDESVLIELDEAFSIVDEYLE